MADEPAPKPGQNPALGAGPYASIANCSPKDGRSSACPGPVCGDKVVGPPDGEAVDLSQCGTLDVAFTSGVVISIVGQADLALHVTGATGGQTRVEASEDGVNYVLVGFIHGAPPGTPTNCLAEQQGDEILVDFDPCNLISTVGFLRLADEAGATGSVKIDAVEALSFEPH